MATPGHVHDHDSGEGLLSVDEARERVLSTIQPLQPLALPLTEAYGCVLAEAWSPSATSPISRPPRWTGSPSAPPTIAPASRRPRRSSCDRRARDDRASAPRARWAAARPSRSRPARPIPAGADTIVPIENAEVVGDSVRILGAVDRGQAHPPERRGRSSRRGAGAGGAAAPGARARAARERRLPAPARASAAARGRAVDRRRADPAVAGPRVRPGPRLERVHAVRSAPRGRRGADARRHRPRRRRRAQGDRVLAPDAGRRVHLLGRGVGGGAGRGEGGVLPPRRGRLLPGGDAAGHAAGVRARSRASRTSACRATP